MEVQDLETTAEANIPKEGPLSYKGFLDYMESNRLIQQVVQDMKEIPELPSEKPVDIHPLERVEGTPDGVFSWMQGHEYAYRGFPWGDVVEKVDIIKKLGRGILSGFFHILKNKNKLWFITLLPALWFLKVLLRANIYAFYRFLLRIRIKPSRYSRAVRETHRAFNSHRPNESETALELRLMLMDLGCMALENDNAYRFRYQEIVGEDLDQEAMRKNPRKELLRLVKIIQSREKTQEIKDTWKLVEMFVRYYLLIDRELLGIIQYVLVNVDKQKIELTPEDKHFCEKREDYEFTHRKQTNVI